MISCVTFDNAHRFGNLLSSQYKLRHKCFLERQSYQAFSYKEMEYDQYDNPSSVYLVYAGINGEALGVSRLTPVRHRCMLKDLWPNMVEDQSIFERDDVWEGTRFCVDKNLPPILRDKVTKELVAAYHEFALEYGITKIIGVMPTIIWKRVLQRNGSHCEILGAIKIIDGQKIQAVSIDTNECSYQNVLNMTGINQRVIDILGQQTFQQAA